jgi:hypothetical protein
MAAKFVAPEPYEHNTFTLEGQELRIIEQGHTDNADTTSLYVQSIGLVVAGEYRTAFEMWSLENFVPPRRNRDPLIDPRGGPRSIEARPGRNVSGQTLIEIPEPCTDLAEGAG